MASGKGARERSVFSLFFFSSSVFPFLSFSFLLTIARGMGEQGVLGLITAMERLVGGSAAIEEILTRPRRSEIAVAVSLYHHGFGRPVFRALCRLWQCRLLAKMVFWRCAAMDEMTRQAPSLSLVVYRKVRPRCLSNE
ncbi:hypothetical protein SODALDRAFT_157534 [Sodiomyces alkalinus F11]|uniref:Uncharacterized protein n=1 Tax=Sodiomyces alkalinus (strain CBS 110278 / VKM F-3762 / F11) TaxID=1314773 RepID=A0A3N2PXZ2_SODAK|nr:hypothetical protein SODALDRAFT_157534 [Sodiomyces alkalinus F11]ROT39352.1 hypothetical protein SODALDRAFT_157534 [Sodiomyces alkalinus F11]